MQVSSSDYDSLQQRCFECHATLKLLEQLVQVVNGFHDVEKLIASKSYVEATQVHTSVRDVLTNIKQAYGNDLVIFPSLIRQHEVLEQKLEMCVKRRWTELVAWSSSPVVMTIASGPDAHEHLQHLCQSLHNLDSLSPLIAKFASQITTEFTDKLLSDCVDTLHDLDAIQDASSVSVKVTTVSQVNGSAVSRTLRKLSVFTTLMELLYENLLNIRVVDEVLAERKATKDVSLAVGTGDGAAAVGDMKPSASSGEEKSSRSLMSMFGKECSVACLQALINNCLSSAIPSRHSQLTEFSQVRAAVEALQTKLVASEFISEDETTITDYVLNVNVLFANKRCVELLDEARRLIMSDIHNIVQVTRRRSGNLSPGNLS